MFLRKKNEMIGQNRNNLEKCNCTYEPCERRGKCYECLHYHLANKELPACCFSDEAEVTYDRSFENFAKDKNLLS